MALRNLVLASNTSLPIWNAVQFGPIQSSSVHFGPIQSTLVQFGPVSITLVKFGLFQSSLVQFDPLAPFRSTLMLFHLFQSISVPFIHSGTGPLWSIQSILGPGPFCPILNIIIFPIFCNLFCFFGKQTQPTIQVTYDKNAIGESRNYFGPIDCLAHQCTSYARYKWPKTTLIFDLLFFL